MAKQSYLEKQLEFPFMEELKREYGKKKWRFGIKDLFGLTTCASLGISGMYIFVELIGSTVQDKPSHYPVFETLYGSLCGIVFYVNHWKNKKYLMSR